MVFLVAWRNDFLGASLMGNDWDGVYLLGRACRLWSWIYRMTSMDKRVISSSFFLYLLYHIQRVIMRWTRSPLSIPSTEEWRARLVRN
jgi:hypothetical protein